MSDRNEYGDAVERVPTCRRINGSVYRCEVALAPASVRHLRINGVTHRPLRGPAQPTVMLAVAYKKGPVSPLIRGYLETTRAVLRSQKQPSPGPSFKPEAPSVPESI